MERQLSFLETKNSALRTRVRPPYLAEEIRFVDERMKGISFCNNREDKSWDKNYDDVNVSRISWSIAYQRK